MDAPTTSSPAGVLPAPSFPLPAPSSPLVRTSGGPGRIAALDVSVRVLVRASDTAGAWALVDYTMPPRFPGPPSHIHDLAEEAFYGLDGVTTLEVEGQIVALGPGEVAVVPRGVAHRFWNAANVPARHLVLLTPGGFEGYFDEVARLAEADGTWPPRDPGALPGLMARYDLRLP